MNERDRIGNDDVLKAKLFAIKAHGDQKYGIHPYEFHLDAVVQILVPYGEMAQIAGYLHDIVEDTPITIEEISSNFGDEIADCIALVTDESGNNRRERKQKTNAKLTATQNKLALVVKAADRLANLIESDADRSSNKLKMYQREHQAFRAAVYRPGLCDDLWRQIDNLINS